MARRPAALPTQNPGRLKRLTLPARNQSVILNGSWRARLRAGRDLPLVTLPIRRRVIALPHGVMIRQQLVVEKKISLLRRSFGGLMGYAHQIHVRQVSVILV